MWELHMDAEARAAAVDTRTAAAEGLQGISVDESGSCAKHYQNLSNAFDLNAGS